LNLRKRIDFFQFLRLEKSPSISLRVTMHKFVCALALAAACLFSGLATSAMAREVVPFVSKQHAPGTIVIRTSEKRLYLVGENGKATRYKIAVGKPQSLWYGTKQVGKKDIEPAWMAPPSLRKDPTAPAVIIPGGAPNNPMGARAIGIGPELEYGIHGTNRPESIGTAASAGCFRMLNEDIIDLYEKVDIGTPIVVLR
jgi:lipoprotein-anchoring transpeptidase ErfK/SrfK